jgi:MFS family permease
MGRESGGTPSTALHVRNVQIFMVGQGLSNMGSFFQIVALSLMVLATTGSGFALGAVMSVAALPMLLFGTWAGVVIDRMRIRRLLVLTSLLGSAQATALAVLAARGDVATPVLILLALLGGCVTIFERPAQQAFLPELVPRELISSAVGLSGAVQSSGRLGGPAIAAILFAWQGPAVCFAFNAVSYFAVVAAMLLLRKDELLEREPQSRERGQLRQGFAYAFHQPVLRRVLLANAVIGCLTVNYPLFYSSLSRFSLHAGPQVFGYAESLNALTAVGGGILLARYYRPTSVRAYGLVCLALAASLTWSALSPNVAFFLGEMPVFGLIAVLYSTTTLSLIQLNTPYELKGRIMSLYTLGFFGTTPVGALIAGALIDGASARAAIGLAAAAPLVCGVVVLGRSQAQRRAAAAPASDVPA